MAGEPEGWGGEVRLPRWLRRWRKPEPEDTPEKRAEGRSASQPQRSVLDNADVPGGGAWMFYDLPGQRGRRRKR